MRKRTELDERQLWQRGNVFKHAFVFLLGALAAEGACKAFGITWAEGPWEAVLLIWASVALCWWEFILRDISPMGRSQKTFFFAMGLCGFLAGVLYRRGLLRRGRVSLCIYGALSALLIYGVLMNISSALLWQSPVSWATIGAYLLSGFPVDCVHAAATVCFLWLFGEPMLEKLDRIKVKYGLLA